MVCTLGAGWWPVPPPDRIDWKNLSVGPGVGGHLLGTDPMGRDIVARLVFGARVSLTVGTIAPLIGLITGSLLGLLAGFYRGYTESIIVGTIDILIAFPRIVFLLVVIFIFGPGLTNLSLAIGVLTIPSFARVARANTIRFAGREFVLAARAAGAHDITILVQEILPNVAVPLLVYMLLVMGFVIIAEGSLGFLGLSVPSPSPSWGGMIAEGREVLDQAPHVSIIPALVMFLTILSVNIIGDWLRESFDARESRL